MQHSVDYYRGALHVIEASNPLRKIIEEMIEEIAPLQAQIEEMTDEIRHYYKTAESEADTNALSE